MPPAGVTDPNLANNTANANTLLGGLINNADPGFSTTGNWTLASPCSGFFGDDISYTPPAPPVATATWTFSSLTPGNYQVSTTWYSPPEFAANRATNAPFTISGGAAPLTVLVNQELNPVDYTPNFSYLGSTWMNLTSSYTLTGTTLTVTLGNLANGYCLGDAILIQQLPASLPAPMPAPAPAIAVTFGAGAEAESLGPATSANPAATGAVNLIQDNGASNYQSNGSWKSAAGAGYGGSTQTSACTTCGDSVAAWQFNGLSPWIEYQAYATWVPGSDRSSTVTYRLYHDLPTPLNMSERVPVNQKFTPTDLIENGTGWKRLGNLIPDRGTVSIELLNTGTGLAVADAIMLVPLVASAEPVVSFNSVAELQAANTPALGMPDATALTIAAARRIGTAAVARWSDAGLSPAERELLEALPLQVADLPGQTLAKLTSAGLLLDQDAAGLDWFVDGSPWEDAEFVTGPTPGNVDLLTTVMVMFGRRLGRSTNDSPETQSLLELSSLPVQTRLVPGSSLLTGQNPVNPLDVDNSGAVTATDVLLLINQINARGTPLTPVLAGQPHLYLDVTVEGTLSAADVLPVINAINQPAAARAAGEASDTLSLASPRLPDADPLRQDSGLGSVDGIATGFATDAVIGGDGDDGDVQRWSLLAKPISQAAPIDTVMAGFATTEATSEDLAPWESVLDELAQNTVRV
jgi:hypothetical protein